MIYIDTSCLLKILLPDKETDAVLQAVSREDRVIISALTQMESLVRLKAAYLGGNNSLPVWRQREARLGTLFNQEPFYFKPVPNAVWATALRQHRNSGDIHCRTLDRLHLAVMEKLGITRLMTHDLGQSEAARDLGFETLSPGK